MSKDPERYTVIIHPDQTREVIYEEKCKVTGDRIVGEILEAIWSIEKEIAYYALLFFIILLGGKGGRDLADRIEVRRFGKSYFSSDTEEDE